MQFMLQYEGLRTMREMQLGSAAAHQEELKHSFSSEKTKADGSPITMIDLIYDKRYAEREHDSDYYESEYYFSEDD